MIHLTSLCLVLIWAFPTYGLIPNRYNGRYIFQKHVKLTQKPNILFILADDLGHNDLSYNGMHHGSAVKTPHIDRLASEGVTLGNYYVQPICSPTRSQLMSGRYQIHTGLEHSIIQPSKPYCLPLDEVTIAQKMKEAGYDTHMVGKWHLGLYKKECLPTSRGFDTFLGYYLGSEGYYNHVRNDGKFKGYDFHEDTQDGLHPARYYLGGEGYYNHVRNDGKFKGYDFHEDTQDALHPAHQYAGQYSTSVFAQESQRIIKSHNTSKPFFVYLPFQAVHTPFEVPEKYSKPYEKLIPTKNRQTLAGMVSCMDEAIGNITTTLKETGLYDNTIIFFSTDNGGPAYESANNWPLRGSKGTLWEGGVHGVGFVHSPLLPKAVQGTTSQAFIHVSDWFPTIVSSLAGGNLNGTKPLDGYDVWGAITKGTPSPRTELLHNIDPLFQVPTNGKSVVALSSFNTSLHAALRVGDWKILTGLPGALLPKRNDWTPPPEANITAFKPVEAIGKHLWLFNITADPYEWNDVSDENPSVVKKMLDRLEEYHQTMVPPLWPDPDPRCDPAKHGGVWGPWE